MFNFNDNDRNEQLRNTAGQLGMEFSEKDEYGMIGLLRDFHLMSKGGSKEITNLMTHSSPLMEDRFHIFDYKYTVSTGKSAVTYRQTVMFINSKHLAMPEMLMKPEHFFHRLGNWLGLEQDIDFEEHPDFSRSYLLQGEDEAHVRRTMNQDEVIRFFTVEKEWCLESVGFFLIFYQDNRLLRPDEIQYFHERGVMLFEQFKVEPL
jgi:hypothetical protein